MIVSTRSVEVGGSTTRSVDEAEPSARVDGSAPSRLGDGAAPPGSSTVGPSSETCGGVGVGVAVGRGVGLGVGFGVAAGFAAGFATGFGLLVDPPPPPLDAHESANRTVHIFLPSAPL